jgi:hypothetical protein
VRGKTVSGTLAQVLDRDPGIDWRDLYTWVLCLGQGNVIGVHGRQSWNFGIPLEIAINILALSSGTASVCSVWARRGRGGGRFVRVQVWLHCLCCRYPPKAKASLFYSMYMNGRRIFLFFEELSRIVSRKCSFSDYTRP